jgi:hypothetical protein
MQTPFDAMNDITVQAMRNVQSMFFQSLQGMQSSFVDSLRDAHTQAVKLHMAPKSLRESAEFEKNLGILRSSMATQLKALEAFVAV